MPAKKTPSAKPKPATAKAIESTPIASGPAPVIAAASAAPVQQIQQTFEKGTETMATKINEAGLAGADRFQNAFGDVSQRAKAAAEKGAKLVEEMTDITKGNVEAMVASSKIVAKGVETLGQEAADYGRRSFEEASAALKSFAEVKSATDLFKLQGDYVRSAFDSWVAESSKASEAVLKLAGEVAEPITSRYSVAAERVKSVAAL